MPMWIRLGSFAVKAGAVEELRATYNDLAVPKVRACAGNLACLLLEPVSAAEPFGALTIWDSRVAAEAYEASGAAGEVVALVRGFFAGPPTLRSYESHSLLGFAAASPEALRVSAP
jgi:heme-degrading monooxygenase HmoA